MELALGQRRRYENVIIKTQRNPLQCVFNVLREGKLDSFFMFRESEKM
jgi:hypothetical protein